MDFPTLYTDCSAPSKERADFTLLTEKRIFNAQTDKDKRSIVDKYNNRIRNFTDTLNEFNHDKNYPKPGFFTPESFNSFNKVMGLDATTEPLNFELKRLKINNIFDILNSDIDPTLASELLLGKESPHMDDTILNPPLANSLYLPKSEKPLNFDTLFKCQLKDSDKSPVIMSPEKYLHALNKYTNNLTRGLLFLNSKIVAKLSEKTEKELNEIKHILLDTELIMEDIYEDKALITFFTLTEDLPGSIRQFREASQKGEVLVKSYIGNAIQNFILYRLGLEESDLLKKGNSETTDEEDEPL
jgi:hypothetical protein